MARSNYKGAFVDPSIIKKIKHIQNFHDATKGKAVIKTKSRASKIISNMIGMHFAVHNGKSYKEITITEAMVGRKLGEFAETREAAKHTNKVAIKKK